MILHPKPFWLFINDFKNENDDFQHFKAAFGALGAPKGQN